MEKENRVKEGAVNLVAVDHWTSLAKVIIYALSLERKSENLGLCRGHNLEGCTYESRGIPEG